MKNLESRISDSGGPGSLADRSRVRVQKEGDMKPLEETHAFPRDFLIANADFYDQCISDILFYLDRLDNALESNASAVSKIEKVRSLSALVRKYTKKIQVRGETNVS